jgi:hypothetical protein
MEFEDNKRRKIMEAQDRKKDSETDGCTFSPEMVTARTGDTRSLD